VKVTILLEELLALGNSGADYDAWLIKIGDGDQFGSGFVAVNPNSKIPALLDRGGANADPSAIPSFCLGNWGREPACV
jgi:GST-like protein